MVFYLTIMAMGCCKGHITVDEDDDKPGMLRRARYVESNPDVVMFKVIEINNVMTRSIFHKRRDEETREWVDIN